jgi:hypothetical protein
VQRERLQFGPVISDFAVLAGVGVPVNRALPVRYGLGIADAGNFLGHNGAVNGFSADMWFEPHTGTTIVVLTNASVIASGQLADIADLMFASAAQAVVPKQTLSTDTGES